MYCLSKQLSFVWNTDLSQKHHILHDKGNIEERGKAVYEVKLKTNKTSNN